ncbi:MAG: filamentous hemagglutinin N-terminal domain-containing protein [Phycisphaerales bacterium]|nr:MAG: filamentous hemagglutinin N-terminal domain-containing protein [Phycisphaerales bacterium]
MRKNSTGGMVTGSGMSRVARLRGRAEWTARPVGMLGGMMAAAMGSVAFASPEGAQVVQGNVGISQQGGLTTITASHNSIINYSSFNVAANEAVRFVQPGATSRVLNRINSATPSQIDGSISANGIVYLINPAGVYFGAGSVINVAGLYAGAASITDSDFLNQIDRFAGGRGAVVNQGTISADFAAFVGGAVHNSGNIVCPEGTVVMAAGSDVLIGERNGQIYARVSGETIARAIEGTHDTAAVANTGTIDTRSASGGSGRVLVGVGDALGVAIANAGRIHARDTRIEGQGTGIVAVGGEIDATNGDGRGGRVEITGERVTLRDAQIDASGTTGGGEVYVGGGMHGEGDVANADRTYVSPGTNIHADATVQGDGGTVVVWSDEATSFRGNATARGGAMGGNGGLVEISSGGLLSLSGKADVTAEEGEAGTILLDPRDITIQATPGPDDGEVTVTIDESVLFADGGAATDFVIGEAALEALQGNIVLQASRDITTSVGATLNLTNQTAGETVVFQAGRTITLNGLISTGGAAIDLRAGDPASGAPDASAALIINATLASNGGNISLSNTGSGGITLSANVLAGTGAVRFSTTSGGITQTVGSITGSTLELVGGGAFVLNQTGNDVDTLAAGINGSLRFTDNDGLAIGSAGATNGISTGGNDVTLVTGAALSLNQGINAGSGVVTLSTASGGVSQTSGGIVAGSMQLLGVGTFTLGSATNNISTLAASINGTLTYVDANALTVGAVTSNGIVTAGNAADITAGSTITLAQGINVGGATLTLNATGGGLTQTGGSVIAGNLRLLGAGAFLLTQTGNDVNVLAGNVNGSVSYTDANSLTIGTVTDVGLTTNGGAALITAPTLLTINNPINAGAGAVVLTTDSISVNSLVTGNAGISIAPFTAGRAIGLNGPSSGLDLSQAEFDNLNSTGTVVIGSASAGAITTNSGATLDLSAESYNLSLQGSSMTLGPITLATGRTLTLNSAGAVGQTGALIATNLRLLGAGSFDLSLAGNDFDVLAGVVTGGVSLRDADGLTIGTVTDSGLSASGITLTTGGTLSLQQNLSSTSSITLALAGGATQTGGAITATQLVLSGSGGFDLQSASNDVSEISGNVFGPLTYRDANALTVGSFAISGLSSNAGAISLRSGGLLTLAADIDSGGAAVSLNAAGVTQTVGSISASTLELLGTGAFTLAQANDVATLAANVAGALTFNDVNALSVGTSGGTTGIATAGGDVSLTAQSVLNVISSVNAGTGFVTLTADSMDVLNTVRGDAGVTVRPFSNGRNVGLGTIAAGLDLSVGELSNFQSLGDVTIGSATTGNVTTSALNLSGTNYNLYLHGSGVSIGGITMASGRRLTLESSSGVTQTGAISASSLRLLGAGDIVLDLGSNDFGTIAGDTTGIVSVTDINGLIVGTAVTSGLRGRNVTLNTGGTITIANDLRGDANTGIVTLNPLAGGVTQTGGSLVSANLRLTGAGAFNLIGASNDVSGFAANVVGSVAFNDADEVFITTIGPVSGVTVTGGNAQITSQGLLTLIADVIAGTGTVELNGGGILQSLGQISAGSLLLRGSGDATLASATNNIATLAANVTGNLLYHDSNALAIGTVSGFQGLTASGNIDVSSGGAIAVGNVVTSTGGDVLIHAGQSGGGNLSFGSGVAVSGDSITLRAGDGLGGSTAAFVDARTNGPIFRGTAGATSNPAAFTIQQDAGVTSSLLPLGSQFGAGSPTGVAYVVRSDDGAMVISQGDSFQGAALTLDALNGLSVATALDGLRSFTTSTALTLSGSIRATTGGSVTINSTVTLAGDSTISAGEFGFVTLGDAVTASAFDLTLEGVEVDFLADITGTGRLTIQPVDPTQTIGVGNIGSSPELDLSLDELAHLVNGFESVTIGRADGTGTIRIAQAISTMNPLIFRTPGGLIDVASAIRADENDAFLAFVGATLLSQNVTTAGTSLAFYGPVTLGADVSLDTTDSGGVAEGADIFIDAPLNADSATNRRTLTLTAGSGGEVSIRAGAGLGTDGTLESLIASGEIVRLSGVRTFGAQTYNGFTGLGGDMTSLEGGAITINGSAAVALDTTIRTAGLVAGDDIVITGVVDSAVSGSEAALSLDAGAGSVTLSGDVGGNMALSDFSATGASVTTQSVAALGAVTYGGPSTLSGTISGDTVVFNERVEVAGATTVNGTTSVTFSDIVESATNEDLTITSAATTFLGEVGSDDGHEIGNLTVSGGTVDIATQFIETLNDQSYGGAVTLNADANLNSALGGITIEGPIDSGSVIHSLRMQVPGESRFGGDVGVTNALSTITIVGGGTLTIAGTSINTTGFQNYDSAIVLDSDVTLAGDTITVTGAIDSGDQGAKALIVDARSGVATLADMGQTNELSSVVVSGAGVSLRAVRTTGAQTYSGETTLNGGTLSSTGAGEIAFNSDVILNGDATVTTAGLASTDSVTFGGAIDSLNTSHSLSVGTGLGSITVTGAVGRGQDATDAPLSDFALTGETISVGAVRTTGVQSYSGMTTLHGDLESTLLGPILLERSVTLAGDVTITTNDGEVAFLSTIDSDGTARNLTVNTGGGSVTRFAGDVGSTSRLATLTTNADGTTQLGGVVVRTTTSQTYNDAVVLAGPTTRIEGPTVTFLGNIDSDSSLTPRALIVNTAATTPGTATLAGNVGSTAALRQLSVTGTGRARIGGDVTATEGITFEGPVRLLGSSIMNAGTGGIWFRATVDTEDSFAPAPLTLLSTMVATADNTPFRFGGSIGATNALASLSIGSDIGNSAQAATIVFTDSFDSTGRITSGTVAATDSFLIRTSGDFTMGRGQRLTSFGRLNIQSGGTARLGDLTSFADITVTANAIVLQLRPAGSILDNFFQTPDQLLPDSGLDIVAAGAINFNQVPTTTGTGGPASFANNSGFAPANLSGFAFRQFPGGVIRNLFVDTRAGGSGFLLPLDLKAEGPSSSLLATSLASAIPGGLEEFGSVGQPVVITSSLEEPLSEMGLTTREMSADDAIEFLVGTRIYGDSGLGMSGTDISTRRLVPRAVERALESYRSLVFAPAIDDKGNPILDENGKAVLIKQTDRIKDTLAEAWEGYKAKVPKSDGLGFRAYLETTGALASPSEVASLEYLTRLREVLDNIDALGLSPYESSIPKSKLLGSVKPGDMTDRDMRQAIYGAIVQIQ